MATLAKTIGIDVGGTNFRVGVFVGDKLLNQYHVEKNLSAICRGVLPAHATFEVLRAFDDEINFLLAEHSDVAAIGVAFPGFIHPVSGVLAQSPNLPGLQDLNLAQALSAQFKKNVAVLNDANAAAYGEYCLLGKPAQGLIYIGLGTGVGGGLVLHGKPFAGFNGCAMEVGHLIVHPQGRRCGCGNFGCLEQYASASGLVKSYFEATKNTLTAHEIANLATAGDTNAQAAYTCAAEALASALAHVLKVVDVPNVVIGGGMSAAWGLMQSAFNARLEADLIPALRGKINLTISKSGDQAGMLGAALLACEL